jgi:hypothetical protein
MWFSYLCFPSSWDYSCIPSTDGAFTNSCLGWPWTAILLISVPRVAGIIGIEQSPAKPEIVLTKRKILLTGGVGSSCRAPTSQMGSPEFKLQYCKKEKKRFAQTSSWTWIWHLTVVHQTDWIREYEKGGRLGHTHTHMHTHTHTHTHTHACTQEGL